MPKLVRFVLAAFCVLPLAALAQDQDAYEQLPASGAHDEGLGKSSVIKLSSNLASHSTTSRLLSNNPLRVSALRWDKESGTVWVYKTNAAHKEPYQHFAIRVFMRQTAPGKVEMKTRVFCDVGPDRFSNITQQACDRVRDDFAPKLVESHRSDFITLISSRSKTHAEAETAAVAIRDAMLVLMGERAPESAQGTGTTTEVEGTID